jgi:dienelactone hydrolase
VAPLGLLPYYFSVEPSPTDDRSAFSVARPVPEGADAGVSVILEDQDQCVEIFRFSRLGSVKIAWSRCGQFLAFAQNSTLMVRDPNGCLDLAVLADNVRFLAFDSSQQLWCLSGDRLDIRVGEEIKLSTEGVECVAVSECAAYCRREQAGLSLYVHDGSSERILAALQDAGGQDAIGLSMHGRYLVAAIGSATIEDRARMRLLRFDVVTGAVDTLMDEQVAIGFNGGPGISAVQLSDGQVLAGYENGICTRVWRVAPGEPPEPISPEGFEVFDFVANASGNRLAIIASDTRSASGACERQLLIGQKAHNSWHVGPVRPGVHDMPRWRSDGDLEVLCGDDGSWTKEICAVPAAHSVEAARWCNSVEVVKATVEYDFIRLPGPQTRPAGIILLPRLHQQFIAGAQQFFFHHFIFSVARELAMEGYSVVALSGPGAIGRGRHRREPGGSSGSYFDQLRSAMHDLVQSLQADGCRSIGILAGSMAAVPALRLAGPGTPFKACAFVVPLFEASIPVTAPCRHYLLDDPLIEPLEKSATDLTVPLLVLQGARDEVVPMEQTTRLRDRVPNRDLVDVRVFENEGHIFMEAQSWQRTLGAVRDFFSSHLTADPAA